MLVVTGIGAVSAAIWSLVLMGVSSGLGDLAGNLAWAPFFAVAGAALGLVTSAPAYAILRLFVRRLSSRASSLLFLFGLGAASAVVALGVLALFFHGNIPMVYTVSNTEIEPLAFALPVISGLLTAACGPIILRPVDTAHYGTLLPS
ncbi:MULTISPECIES: hypothetical protein [unclassified Brevibacterium]|uniref:hypothetical protein n=1 Tax=unclassified Brevibacterium TaxID=2614124 RepID=UPI0010918A4C|nr:hypothetical protein [Brevibacterium sp. S22]